MMFDPKIWRVVDRPGFLGKKRDKVYAEFNGRYGRDNWKFSWVVTRHSRDLLLEFDEAITLYEDAYFVYMNDAIVNQITSYKNVYDNYPTNIDSGLDYRIQETNANHYQDISIRRVLLRKGHWFEDGRKELLHVRESSNQLLGVTLSPGRVPFHIPELIRRPEIEGWWKSGSVESFWQSNKVVVVLDKISRG